MGHGCGAGRFLAIDRTKLKKSRPTPILIKSLLGYIKGYKWTIIGVGVILTIYAVFNIVNPIVISKGIDMVTYSHKKDYKLIIALGSIFLVLASSSWVLNSISTRLLAKVNSQMLHGVRMDIYKKLNEADIHYIHEQESGNITARVTADTAELATGVNISTSIISNILVLVGSFIVLMVTSWIIGLITLISIPISLGIASILSYFGRRIVLRIRHSFGKVSAKMAESLAGIAVAKTFNREEELAAELKQLNREYYRYSKQFGVMMMTIMPAIRSLSTILVAIIIYIGGILSNTTHALTIGEIYLGVTLSQRFLFPVVNLAMSFPQLESALGAMDRILDVLETRPSVTDAPDAEELRGDDYSVTFEGLYFAYEDENYVLKNINLHIEEGKTVAVIGHTGAGKTTLLATLLPRFYDPQKGKILIGNQDIRRIKLSSLRKAIGLIPQEPYLFTGTVLENLRYGAPDAPLEKIFEVCKKIGAEDFILALPNGYNTHIQEGGKKLSAGQKQMITIARAMLADPKILVLDEATSRLDTYTESLVQAAQEELFKGRTTFVIAHRLSTIRNADLIVVLDHGEIKEVGTHDELIEKKGIYADLYYTYYAHQGLAKIEIDETALGPEKLNISELPRTFIRRKKVK